MNDSDKPSRKTFGTRLKYMIDSLRSEIGRGAYGPGDYLPSEKALTEKYGLSNKSVRKGLDTLVEEGLIVKLDRIGSKVTEKVPAGGATLTLGYHGSIERDIGLAALLDDFRSLHPSVSVKTLPIKSSPDYMDTLKEYVDNGMFDVFTINNLDFQNMIDRNWLQEQLLERLPADESLYPFAQEAFTYNGELYVRPVIFSPIILAYNRAHYRESQVSEPDGGWTWAEAIRRASELTVPGVRHGLYFYLLSDNRWPAFLLQSGMKFGQGENGEASDDLEGTAMLECMRLCKTIISDRSIFPSYLSENSDDVNELFLQGKVSMIMTNYMTINEFKNTNLDYDISPLPYSYEQRSLVNVIGVAVSKHSRHVEAARQLADYFASPRAQRLIRAGTLSLPVRKEAAEAPLQSGEGMNRPSRYFLFREIMASYRLHSGLNLSYTAFTALRQLLKKYWSGLIGEDELCRRIREEVTGPR